jgi:hypothetical protein
MDEKMGNWPTQPEDGKPIRTTTGSEPAVMTVADAAERIDDGAPAEDHETD